MVFWSRSLLVRVVVLTLSLSTIVMVTLGLILQQQITTGLLRSKIDAATAEIDSARQTVQSSLSGADSDPSSLREQLRLALAEIGRADGSSGAQGSTAGVFEPVIVPSRIGSEADLSDRPADRRRPGGAAGPGRAGPDRLPVHDHPARRAEHPGAGDGQPGPDQHRLVRGVPDLPAGR